jgi:ABC-2 type transport system permease protein
MTGPRPGAPTGANAAPLSHRVLAQARFEVAALLRNGEQLLLLAILPALVLVGLTATGIVAIETDGLPRVDVVAPGVLALAVMSTAFTSQAIATAFDRRGGVLRLLATTPLGRGGLLAGKASAVVVVEALQLVLLGGLALALGWAPDPAGVPAAALAVALGTTAFVGLALLMAGTMRAEAVLGAANLVWVLLLVGGGVVVPLTQLPSTWATLAGLLPSGALAQALRIAFAGGDGGALVGPLSVLTAWAVGAGLAAHRSFRWS